MKIILVVLVLLAFGLFALVVLKKRGLLGGSGGPWPLPEHIVLAQVQVSRVLGVKKGFKFHEWNNRINRLSYDFVVCGKDSTVLAAIELDDKSHELPSRAETDKKKEKAKLAANVQIIRWHVKSLPDHAAIQAAFAKQQSKPSIEWTA